MEGRKQQRAGRRYTAGGSDCRKRRQECYWTHRPIPLAQVISARCSTGRDQREAARNAVWGPAWSWPVMAAGGTHRALEPPSAARGPARCGGWVQWVQWVQACTGLHWLQRLAAQRQRCSARAAGAGEQRRAGQQDDDGHRDALLWWRGCAVRCPSPIHPRGVACSPPPLTPIMTLPPSTRPSPDSRLSPGRSPAAVPNYVSLHLAKIEK